MTGIPVMRNMDGSKTSKITIKLDRKAPRKNKTLTWVTDGNMPKETGGNEATKNYRL